jgi:hypothetical protein
MSLDKSISYSQAPRDHMGWANPDIDRLTMTASVTFSAEMGHTANMTSHAKKVLTEDIYKQVYGPIRSLVKQLRFFDEALHLRHSDYLKYQAVLTQIEKEIYPPGT